MSKLNEFEHVLGDACMIRGDLDKVIEPGLWGGVEGGEGYLLAIIEISTVQSFAQTFIRNAILFIG